MTSLGPREPDYHVPLMGNCDACGEWHRVFEARRLREPDQRTGERTRQELLCIGCFSRLLHDEAF